MTNPYDPQYGQPGGQPYSGQPGYGGQPGGQPYSGQPYSGQPGGQPYSGQPGGQPYSGQPGYGTPQNYPGTPAGPPSSMGPDPNQPGYASGYQLPGQSLAAIARKRGLRQVYTGLGIFAAALVITIALKGFVVFWGAMVVGIVWTIRGLVLVSRANRLR